MPLKRIVGVFLALALVGLAAILVVAARGDGERFTSMVASGKHPVAPVVRLDRLGADGQGSIADYRGEVAVVNFFASWCQPCKDEAPLLSSLSKRLAAEDVAMIGIASEDTREAALAFAQEQHLDYDLYHARGREAAEPWGVSGYPETFVIDAVGRATAWFSGPVDEAALLDAVEKAKAGS